MDLKGLKGLMEDEDEDEELEAHRGYLHVVNMAWQSIVEKRYISLLGLLTQSLITLR